MDKNQNILKRLEQLRKNFPVGVQKWVDLARSNKQYFLNFGLTALHTISLQLFCLVKMKRGRQCFDAYHILIF